MPAPTPSFVSCLSRYLRENAHRAINKTDRCMASKLEQHLGHLALDEVTPQALSAMRDKLLLRYSSQSVVHFLGLVSRVYVAAERDWFIWAGDNPVKRTRKPSTANTGRERVLSRDELDRIVASLSGPVAAFVMVAYETGMRRGEIARIRAEDVNWDRRTLLIPTTKTGVPRRIPLSSGALHWLQRLLDGPVPAPDVVTRAFKAAADHARVRGVRLHDLRHTAVTGFFEKGLNMMEVAAISGHKTLSMLARYTHLNPERLVDRLG